MSDRLRTVLVLAAVLGFVAVALGVTLFLTWDSSFRVSPEEEHIISSKPELKVSFSRNSAPFSFITDSGIINGMSNDGIREVAKRIAAPIKFVELAPSEMAEALRSGSIDLACCSGGEGTLNDTVSAGVLFEVPISVYVTPDKKGVRALKDLSPIGIVGGDPAESYVRNFVSGVLLSKEPNYDALLHKLIEGGVPAIAGKDQMVRYMARQKGQEGLIYRLQHGLVITEVKLHARPEDSVLAALVERAVTAVRKDGTLKRIEESYLGTESIETTTSADRKFQILAGLLVLSLLIILSLWLYGPQRRGVGSGLVLTVGNPLQELSGPAPVTSLSVRKLASAMARLFRFTRVVYQNADGDLVLIPDPQAGQEDDAERLLEAIESPVLAPLTNRPGWFGCVLPRGGKIAVLGRIKEPPDEPTCVLCSFFASAIEMVSVASDSSADLRFVREVMKVGMKQNGSIVLVTTPDLRVDEAWGAIAGVEAAELRGKSFTDIMVPGDLEGLQYALERSAALKDGAVQGRCSLLLAKDTIPVTYWVSQRILSRGMCPVISLHDERLGAEVAEKAMNASKLEAPGIIASSFLSVLERMFLAIQGYVGQIVMSSGSESPQIERITHYARRGATLGEALTRIVQGSRSPLTLMDIKPFVEDYIRPLADSFDGSTIRIESPERVTYVEIDPDVLSIAVLAVLINAVEASPSGGEIVLSVSSIEHRKPARFANTTIRAGKYAVISVKDCGSGIAQADLEKVFQPLYTTKGRGRSGLGLVAAETAARANGGRVAVTETSPRGTTFSIFLPARELTTAVEEELKGDGASVLIMSSSIEWLDILSDILKRYDYQVSGVSRLADCSKLVKLQSFDCILFDYDRSAGEVVVVIEEIRKIRPGTPIVIMLASSEARAFTMLGQFRGVTVIGRSSDVRQVVRSVKSAVSADK